MVRSLDWLQRGVVALEHAQMAQLDRRICRVHRLVFRILVRCAMGAAAAGIELSVRNRRFPGRAILKVGRSGLRAGALQRFRRQPGSDQFKPRIVRGQSPARPRSFPARGHCETWPGPILALGQEHCFFDIRQFGPQHERTNLQSGAAQMTDGIFTASTRCRREIQAIDRRNRGAGSLSIRRSVAGHSPRSLGIQNEPGPCLPG